MMDDGRWTSQWQSSPVAICWTATVRTLGFVFMESLNPLWGSFGSKQTVIPELFVSECPLHSTQPNTVMKLLVFHFVCTLKGLFELFVSIKKNKKKTIMCSSPFVDDASSKRTDAHNRHIVLFVAIIVLINWRYALFCKLFSKLGLN